MDYKLKNTLDNIYKDITDLENERDLYKKKLEEFDKDKEIQALKAKIQILERGNEFAISYQEEEAINEWKAANNLHNFGAIGGSFTYEFIPTSIGTIGTIRHSNGKNFCFRDIE